MRTEIGRIDKKFVVGSFLSTLKSLYLHTYVVSQSQPFYFFSFLFLLLSAADADSSRCWPPHIQRKERTVIPLPSFPIAAVHEWNCLCAIRPSCCQCASVAAVVCAFFFHLHPPPLFSFYSLRCSFSFQFNAQSVCLCVGAVTAVRAFFSLFIGKQMRCGWKNRKMSGRHSSPCRAHDENEQLLYGVTLDICLNDNNSSNHDDARSALHSLLQLHSWSKQRMKKNYLRTNILAAWLHMCVGWLIIISVLIYRGQEWWSDREWNSTTSSNVGRAASSAAIPLNKQHKRHAQIEVAISRFLNVNATSFALILFVLAQRVNEWMQCIRTNVAVVVVVVVVLPLASFARTFVGFFACLFWCIVVCKCQPAQLPD